MKLFILFGLLVASISFAEEKNIGRTLISRLIQDNGQVIQSSMYLTSHLEQLDIDNLCYTIGTLSGKMSSF